MSNFFTNYLSLIIHSIVAIRWQNGARNELKRLDILTTLFDMKSMVRTEFQSNMKLAARRYGHPWLVSTFTQFIDWTNTTISYQFDLVEPSRRFLFTQETKNRPTAVPFPDYTFELQNAPSTGWNPSTSTRQVDMRRNLCWHKLDRRLHKRTGGIDVSSPHNGQLLTHLFFDWRMNCWILRAAWCCLRCE